MNLNQLRFAKAAADASSFSKAAEACCVTQPTLSNGIAQLEKELGDKLFERTTRKVSLTAFGTQMLPLIESVIMAQSELTAGARAYFQPEHQLIRIGMSPLIDARLLNQALTPFRAEFPDTDIFFKDCFLNDLGDRVAKGQLDILLRPHIVNDAMGRALKRIDFYQEDLYFLPCQSGLQQDKRGGPVLLKEIAKQTFILSYDGCGLKTVTRNLFSDAGLRLKEYAGQTMSYQVMQEWADIGIGATILPFSRLSPDSKKKARRLMITPKKPARLRIDAYWPKASAYPNHIAALHSHLAQSAPKIVSDLLDS